MSEEQFGLKALAESLQEGQALIVPLGHVRFLVIAGTTEVDLTDVAPVRAERNIAILSRLLRWIDQVVGEFARLRGLDLGDPVFDGRLGSTLRLLNAGTLDGDGASQEIQQCMRIRFPLKRTSDPHTT